MAPLELNYSGVDYLLHSSASVRQSIDEVPPYDEGREDPSLAVVSESIVDIESNQKATHCEVRQFEPAMEEILIFIYIYSLDCLHRPNLTL